ncbi:MFS transporter [Lysinibacillus piscis]|uniref:MFS transporter n=1 Tax=Lysinibacillus piscis TaxID=2518931 RepID=A0ABQ5NNX9_9BACI|nr:MFS transporter [Lysinibacillus sp. KH24]GLC90086.1 MFS transporter [Lysinibacillus sp. KH24]
MQKINIKQTSLVSVIVILFWLSQYIYVPHQTLYLNVVHVSSQFIGIIIGAYGISQLLLRLPMGIMADLSNNHKLFIILGTLCASMASLFRILSPNEVGFLVGNILSGAASSTWISFMILYMSYYSSAKQIVATSQIILANNIGILLGFVLSTFLYDLMGMRWLCAISLIAGLIGCILSFFIHSVERKQEPNMTILNLLTVFKNKELLIFSLLALIQQGIQMASTMSFTNQILENLGATTTIIGLSSIIYMLSAVFFARMTSTHMLGKMSKKNWIYSIFMCLSTYCVLVSHTSSITVICFLQLIPGIATGTLFSLLTSEAMRTIEPQKKSTAMGLFQAVYAIGMTVFPIISGVLYEQISIQAAYYFLACSGLVAIGLAFLYFKMKQAQT